MGRRIENQIDKIYGKLKIINEHSKTRNGHYRYICQCECGNFANVLLTHLRQGNTKSCGCDKPIGNTHHQWEGVGEISGDYWYNHVIRNANKSKGRRSLDLNITKDYMWDLFLKQNRKCALSGITINFPKSNKDRSYNASIDRIDSSLGYIVGNVQWVDKDVNMMKRTYNNEYFIKICNLIAEHNNLKIN